MSNVEECKVRLAKAEQVESTLKRLREEVIPCIFKNSSPVSFEDDFGERGPIETVESGSVVGLEFRFKINSEPKEFCKDFLDGRFYSHVVQNSRNVKSQGFFAAYCVKLDSNQLFHTMTFIPVHKAVPIVAKAQYGPEDLNTPASFVNRVFEAPQKDFFRVMFPAQGSAANQPKYADFKAFVEGISVGAFLSPQPSKPPAPTGSKKRKQPASNPSVRAEVAALIKLRERKPDPLPGRDVAWAVVQRLLERPQDGLFGLFALSGETLRGFMEAVASTSDAGGAVARQLAEIRLAQDDPMETDLASKAQDLQKERAICDLVSRYRGSDAEGNFGFFVCFYYGLGQSGCLLDCADELEQLVVGPLGSAARGLAALRSGVHFDSLEPRILRKRMTALMEAKDAPEEEQDEGDANAVLFAVVSLFQDCKQWAWKARDPKVFVGHVKNFLKLCADPIVAPLALSPWVFELVSDDCELPGGERDTDKVDLQKKLSAEYADAATRQISPGTLVWLPPPDSMDALLDMF